MPEDKCTKMGERVIDVLAGKHLNLRYPDLDRDDNIAFEQYESCPDPVPLMLPAHCALCSCGLTVLGSGDLLPTGPEQAS